MSRPSDIKAFIDSQELVRHFNEDEAVWRRYRQKRELRRLRTSSNPLPKEVLDRLDWLEAERECRERQYVEMIVEEAVQSNHSQAPLQSMNSPILSCPR